MDHLEIINDDLTAHGHERAGLHRWVKQNEGGQLQVQAGAEIQKGRMVVFTGRFASSDLTYTVAGVWTSDKGDYTAMMEVMRNGEAVPIKQNGHHPKLSGLLAELERDARRVAEFAL